VIGAITAGLYAGGVPPVTNSYESIATVIVGAGGSSSIDFTSIPSTYKHLQIRAISRDNRSSSSFNNTLMRFNGDTGSNYAWHLLIGDGSSASADAAASQTENTTFVNTGPNLNANIFGAGIIDILDYGNTNKYKTSRILTGADSNGGGSIRLWSGLWMNTNAITSIKLFPSSSASFVQYSSFALYGIKG